MQEVRANPDLLSFVIPVYNEQEVLPLLYSRLCEIADKLPCPVEWVFVNDGSSDRSWSILAELAAKDTRVKVVDLTRNFGHQAALTAGLDYARGEAVVVIDADLQDPPELVFDMLERYREGYDIVYAQRVKRHGESWFKLITAELFYKIMKRYIHKDLPVNTGDFRLLSRAVVNAFAEMREYHRFLRGMSAWMGYKQIGVSFERQPRAAGHTKYTVRKMFRFAWDAILSFSTLPLRVSIYFGLGVIVFGMLYSIYAVARYFIYHDLVQGWASLVVLQCVIGGTILVCLGMIGEYIGRIYEEIKYRPLYMVYRTLNTSLMSVPPRSVIPETRRRNRGTRD
ncbi:MAG: glycosyltransferase family 2 protein [Acidobacteriota bacterium]|nr:glycosyltransferase family 2 protein [Blastocatellia bacterium]MDW8411734.1 glycosyltransferase family 2 protein [Acidobacteriota bacterium]